MNPCAAAHWVRSIVANFFNLEYSKNMLAYHMDITSAAHPHSVMTTSTDTAPEKQSRNS